MLLAWGLRCYPGALMLDHVAANQTRFVAPGLAPDPRGVALGRYCVVLLPSLDRVVGLFRGLSERTSLDDLLSALKITQVKTPLQSQEFLVQLPAQSSFAADTLAQVANLMGGLTFTGSSKHFVKYRDTRSPLGYDVDSLHSGAGDVVLYAGDFVQAYTHVRDLPFDRLALGLSLEKVRGDRVLDNEAALARVVPGLWRYVVGYLHRNNLPCKAAACESEMSPGQSEPERFYLVQTRLHGRMEKLFRTTPGIELYRFEGERVAVEVGYRHPLELSSCSSVFPGGRFYLLSGRRDRQDVIIGNPTYVDASALVSIGAPVRTPVSVSGAPIDIEGVNVPLRLVCSLAPRQSVAASRIPAIQAPWLKKLIYMLPPQVLEETQICVAGDHIYLHNPRGLEFLPLGEMFYQAADGVMVPVGHELIPRIHPEVLVQHLQGGPDKLFFFVRGDADDKQTGSVPLLLPRSGFTPLSRKAMAHVLVRPLTPQALSGVMEQAQLSLVNDPVGAFPLWGFTANKTGGDE